MGDVPSEPSKHGKSSEVTTRIYQREMLNASLIENIIIAQDTGSGKTHIAVLRLKIERDREPRKVSWFIAPIVALCEQQHDVIEKSIGSVGLIIGRMEPKRWMDPKIWKEILRKNRVIVSTPQVLLDALSYGYINLGRDIGLLVFDEAHHVKDNHPMNRIMRDFYDRLPVRQSTRANNHGPVREERPMILGLTASPMFGGNAIMAFRKLETNLDSVIRSPRRHRDELEAHVHRPEFRHVFYSTPYQTDETCSWASKNLRELAQVAQMMDIRQDPYILHLRKSLAETHDAERIRVDQLLSETIFKSDSYTHKGMRDLVNTARDICSDLGPWAADWYVQRVTEMAKNAPTHAEMMTALQEKEKAYLIDHLKGVNITPVSFAPQSIEDSISKKLQIFIQTLEEEKERAELFGDPYSGIVFVKRRASVLALTVVLQHHPRTRESFRVGCLLGSSESSERVTFLDITRQNLLQPQAKALNEFRSGEKNLVIATSVAEEGLDIQACGNVIRWDIPENMASFAQSRGRARKKHSSFVLMLDREDPNHARIARFEQLERDMVAQYNTEREAVNRPFSSEEEDEFEPCEFKVESTGALLTLQSAISRLNRFCSVIPSTRHTNYAPIYDIDPPDMPEGWHALADEHQVPPKNKGPFGCTLTLPKAVTPQLRVHVVERIYPSKRSACKHVAFKAYLALYEAGLVNDHLLPLTERELDDEVKDMLKDVERRDGMTSVSSQLNPWLPSIDQESWWWTEITIEGLSSLTLLTRVNIPAIGPTDELPVLYHPRRGRTEVKLRPSQAVLLSQDALTAAQESTRRLFWSSYSSRMDWSRLDFAYLFVINRDPDADTWSFRRNWATMVEDQERPGRPQTVNAEVFGSQNLYPTNLTWVRDGRLFGKLYRFVRWHYEKLEEEGEAAILSWPLYSRLGVVQVTYPLLVVEPLPPRSNFLLPLSVSETTQKPFFLLAKHAYLELLSPTECEYSQILPSILRRLETAMIIKSFRSTLFPRPPFSSIPSSLVMTAMTAPVSQEPTNYQRLETLGDTVLKFVVTLNLLASHPLWHEGYLSKRKDHVVANSRLAKEAIRRSMFRWIIRSRFSPKRFKPLYLSASKQATVVQDKPPEETNEEPLVGEGETRNEVEELSTKMLADVVEALIGAAYLHGGFDLGVSCARLFGLGLEWHTLPECIETALSRVEHTDEVSEQLRNVERMLGYTFRHKLLLVEALTHASCLHDDRTMSYERMEFLGDALLDMIVVDFLYKYPGKTYYGPNDIHTRKSAVVNTHFLAYVCIGTCLDVDASMPGPGPQGEVVMHSKKHTIRLFQCLQHSSSVILEDQNLMLDRYSKVKDEIESALATGGLFPWAALARLQAPKVFSDMIECLIGAVYLDSEGNMDTVKALLWRMGILGHLDRLIRDDVIVLHPSERLGIWASRQHKELGTKYDEEGELVSCTISMEGREPVSASAEKRGHASREEAHFVAAEKAISEWVVSGRAESGTG